MQWYITVAAVREFQEILGLPEDNDGPGFDGAAKQLDEICRQAKLAKDEGHRQIYRVKALIRGKVARLELTVATGQRPEGPLPQLVRVRRKG